ncbi:hypothetical protein RUND412_004196 [Rhizina undulata]
MERPPAYSLEVLADRSLVKEAVRGIISTIFFHRFFPTVRPKTRDVLDLTLPAVDDVELDELIDQRVAQLVKSIEATSTGTAKSHRGQIAVQFFERRTRKAWFSKEEKICWEQWILSVTLVTSRNDAERSKTRKLTETQLQAAVLEIITIASTRKDHIPPITSNDDNPFPYSIVVSQKGETWGARIGIF